LSFPRVLFRSARLPTSWCPLSIFFLVAWVVHTGDLVSPWVGGFFTFLFCFYLLAHCSGISAVAIFHSRLAIGHESMWGQAFSIWPSVMSCAVPDLFSFLSCYVVEDMTSHMFLFPTLLVLPPSVARHLAHIMQSCPCNRFHKHAVLLYHPPLFPNVGSRAIKIVLASTLAPTFRSPFPQT